MEEIVIRNVSEDLIEEYLDECIKQAGICDCKRCKADVKAYALNNYPQNYVVSTKGDLFVKTKAMSYQSKTDIITAIMKGVKIVGDNPRHD